MLEYYSQNVHEELFRVDVFWTGPWFTFKGEFAQIVNGIFAKGGYIDPLVEYMAETAYYGYRKGI
jgi:hypothetical protein